MFEQLDELLKGQQEILKILREIIKVQPDKEMLSNTEACFLLGVSKKTLGKYRTDGLPHSRVKNKFYYKKQDLIAFIEKHEVLKISKSVNK